MTARVVRIQAEWVLDAQAELGEGPLWDDEKGEIVWVDIPRGRVHRYDPTAGEDRWRDCGSDVGAAALRQGDGLVLALQEGFALWNGDRPVVIAPVNEGRPDVRMNDGKVDPAGRFWAGTMAYDTRAGAGSLYCLEPDHTARSVLDGLTIANGMDWSADGTAMYFIDSMAGGVDRFDFDVADGSIANRRRVVEVPESLGLPDGMTVDAEGCLWVAIWGSGQVRRYTTDGSLLAVVEVPTEHVTSCAFGGPELADLYITTASDSAARVDQERRGSHGGGLFVCRPGPRGRPVRRYAG
jgi:sugar lactone lactonase YvrE